MSFLTSACDLPQKLQRVSWVGRAIESTIYGLRFTICGCDWWREGPVTERFESGLRRFLFQRFFGVAQARNLFPGFHHFIHQAVILRVLGVHEPVAVGVFVV